MASSGLGAAAGDATDAASADAGSTPLSNHIPSGPNHGSSYGGGLSDSAPGRTCHQPESGGTDNNSIGSPFSLSEIATQGDGIGRPRSTTPNNSDAGKKRKTGPGSRGVANLTPEQLARKRANDREAQRAIRERHRLRTEQYEHEIRELKSKQPYQELQAVLRQKEAVEAELAEVKRCMAAIMAMVQPILAPPAGADAGAVDQSPPGPSPCPSHPSSQALATPLPSGSTPTSVTSPASVGTHGRWQSAESLSPVVPSASVDRQSQPPAEALLNQQRYDLARGMDLGSDRLQLDFLVDSNQKIARIQNGVNGAQDSPQYRHEPMKHDWTAAISSTAHHPPYSQPTIPTILPPTAFPPTITNTTADIHFSAPLPRTSGPTCPLDALLLDFLAERRQCAAEGRPQTDVVGPRYPSVSSLLNPAMSAYSHPLSKVFTDILARFPLVSALPERVAILYIMFFNMRWQVLPTQENYLRVPEWLRPLPVQTVKEHAAWIDFVPFPKMREKMVSDYEPGGFSFDEFFVPYTETICVNWPYEDASVLLASPSGDEIMINPVFELHLGMLKNWTLGEVFHRTFPSLAGTYNLKSGS